MMMMMVMMVMIIILIITIMLFLGFCMLKMVGAASVSGLPHPVSLSACWVDQVHDIPVMSARS